MAQGVNVKVVEDNSVELKLKKVALKLSNKYNKKRKINERLLRQKSLPRRIFGVLINVFVSIFFAVLIFSVGSAVYNKVNNIPPSFAGYYSMKIASGSMINSGFDIGDSVIVRGVDTKTLKVNDIIAFYAVDSGLSESTLKPVDPSTSKLQYKTTLTGFFGIVTSEIRTVAKQNRTLVFHHIKAIYEDANGTRFFKTYGSSNFISGTEENAVDTWLINENMIVGSYDGSNLAKVGAKIINVITTPAALFYVLLIPLVFMIYSLIKNALKNVQLAFLECDVVEEKRKLTDEICVKNNIGYRMDNKTKYKVLAQASDDQKLEYINLLWKTDNRPENIRKYYLRKNIILRPMQKLRDVNRNCEQMFKDGVQPVKIAQYYTQEKEKIQAEQKRYKTLVRKIGENYKAENNSKVELATPQNAKNFKVTITNMRGQLPKQINSQKPTPNSESKLAETVAKTVTKKPKVEGVKNAKPSSTKTQKPKKPVSTKTTTQKPKK